MSDNHFNPFDWFDPSLYPSGSESQRPHYAADQPERDIRESAVFKLFAASAGEDPYAILDPIVEKPDWFIRVNEDGRPWLAEAKPGKHQPALSGETAAGGLLLALYPAPPDKAHRQVDGRDLHGIIPPEATGLLIHQADGSRPRELGAAHLPKLKIISASGQLSDMLAAPAPCQLEALLNAPWFLHVSEGKLTIASVEQARLGDAATHLIHHSFASHQTTPTRGREVFERVLAEGLDGLLIHQSRHLRVIPGAPRSYRQVLSAGILHGFLRGEDLRPGAAPLPARNELEIETWVSFRRLLGSGPRNLVKTREGGRNLAQVVWETEVFGEAYRPQEFAEGARHGLSLEKMRSPVFELPEVDPATPTEIYGPGPSRVLCPGLLASHLNPRWHKTPEEIRGIRPGRWLLLGRYLDKFDRKESLKKANYAQEALKLIPPGQDTVPRAALLSVAGASVFREFPFAATRSWLEAMRDRYLRYTKPWVWGF